MHICKRKIYMHICFARGSQSAGEETPCIDEDIGLSKALDLRHRIA